MKVEGENIILYFQGANSGKKHDLVSKDNRVGFVIECTHGIVTGKAVGAYLLKIEKLASHNGMSVRQ